jgi:hypothetical protein
LEFLGDTVLQVRNKDNNLIFYQKKLFFNFEHKIEYTVNFQLLTSDFLYKHFPHHQEGHLSLLRTCLVSNRTQSVVCDDLAMGSYLVVPQVKLIKIIMGSIKFIFRHFYVNSLKFNCVSRTKQIWFI